MIVSVSRRTDIPAYYGEWFLNRLKAGEVLVRNPLNRRQVSRIPLKKDNVDSFVFWTKDPGPFLPSLDELDSYRIPYYFTITVTPYSFDIERNLRSKQAIIASISSLVERIGSKRIIWRYDPLIFSTSLSSEYHLEAFDSLSSEFEGMTEKCVFSFLTEYRKIERFIGDTGVCTGQFEEKKLLIEEMADIAKRKGMTLASCSVSEDYSDLGVKHNRCIDPFLIEEICGYKISSRKDKSQREACGCVESRDIGSYNTCLHECSYCYANRDQNSIRRKAGFYNPGSPMLCDSLMGDEIISDCRSCGSLRVRGVQRRLFDD